VGCLESSLFKKFEMSICYNTVRRSHGACGANAWLHHTELAGGQVEPLRSYTRVAAGPEHVDGIIIT
jgi:hypothetical protein